MKNKLSVVLKKGFIFYCIMYTVITIFSSTLQLFQGRTEDTNAHLLNRAVVCLIAVFVMEACANIRLKSQILTWLVVYSIGMSIVFIYVWITGFFEPLSKYAYRDIFLNFTAVGVVIGVVIAIIEKRKEKRGRQANENKSVS
ncbi:MAG: hypothetical protein K0R34_552 [Herbinix sp.]|nr:hypothetical protein [Herbinix sp.]